MSVPPLAVWSRAERLVKLVNARGGKLIGCTGWRSLSGPSSSFHPSFLLYLPFSDIHIPSSSLLLVSFCPPLPPSLSPSLLFVFLLFSFSSAFFSYFLFPFLLFFLCLFPFLSPLPYFSLSLFNHSLLLFLFISLLLHLIPLFELHFSPQSFLVALLPNKRWRRSLKKVLWICSSTCSGGAAALSAVCQARGSGRTGTCCVWRQLHSGWNNNLSPSWVKLFMKSNTVQAVYCAGGLSATSHTPNKHMTNDSNTTTEETNWSWCLYREQTSNQSSILADTFMKPYTTLICLNQSSDRFWIRLNVSEPLWFAPQPDDFSTDLIHGGHFPLSWYSAVIRLKVILK